jgi:glycerol uptake facilitator-like aquaporin
MLRRRLLAEGLGTALLLAVVIGSGVMGERLAGGNVAVALLANTLATVAGLYVLIELLGPVSGAHFNPAVSLVLCARGALQPGALVPYVAAQLLGAAAGAWAAHAMFGLEVLQVSRHVRPGSGQWLAEGVATFGLVLVVLRAPAPRAAVMVAAWIGSAYWFTSSTSFANPARRVRAHAERYVRRHRPGQCAGLHRRGDRGRRPGRPRPSRTRSGRAGFRYPFQHPPWLTSRSITTPPAARHATCSR